MPRVTIIITSVLRSRVNEELFASKNSLVRQDNQSVAVYNLFLRAMPQLDLETPTGQVDWHYNISTPTLAYSSTIIPELPCVLFLHGNYCPQDIFEAQFSDPRLRENLNLIAVDMRTFGSTNGPVTKEDYTPAVAADDVYRFLKSLQLPPVHVFGLSIGCCIALELAIAHPDLVHSLTLCSPPSASEPEEAAAGRIEVYEYWEKAMVHESNRSAQTSAETFDPTMLDDLVWGVQQLLFNNQTNRMVDALIMHSMAGAKNSWAGSPEKLKVTRILSVDWFLDRKPLSVESLAKINCPISLIHCADDIAYPIKSAQELQSLLQEAGRTDVFLYQVPGPHFGNFINPQPINSILRDFVLSVENHESQPEPLSEDEFRQKMVTPFTAILARYGYDPFTDSDDEPF